MSDLKDVTWAVQSTVTEPDFDTIVRRAGRRRARHLAVTATAGVTAAVVVSALVVSAPLRDRSADPAVTVPPPTQTSPLPPLQSAREIVTAPNATVEGVAMTADGRWIAVWQSCNDDQSNCQRATVTNDGDRKVMGTPGRDWVFAYENQGRLFAFTEPLGADTVSPRPGRLLTFVGTDRRESSLTEAPATTTFGDSEVVLGMERPVVLNLARSTYRTLDLRRPEARYGGTSLSDGRAWLSADGPDRPAILSTQNAGRSWQDLPLDSVEGMVSVSSNGRHVVTVSMLSSVNEGTEQQDKIAFPVKTIKVSHDGGATWSTFAAPFWTLDEVPAVLDDGSVVLAGHDRGVDITTAYRIPSGGSATKLPAFPAGRQMLRASGNLLYGWNGRKVQTSDDGGQTWKSVEPR